MTEGDKPEREAVAVSADGLAELGADDVILLAPPSFSFMLLDASSTMTVRQILLDRGLSSAAAVPAPRRTAARSASLSPAQRFPRMAFLIRQVWPRTVIPFSDAHD